MLDLERKMQEIITAGKRIYQRELVAGTDGNISIRCGDVLLITATSVSKGFLEQNKIAMIDLTGKSLLPEVKPSSEAAMHAAIYRARPDVNAVIHGHPPFATAYALAGKAFPNELVEARLMLGEIPLLPFAEAGSSLLAQQVGQACTTCRGALLQGHGAIVWDATMDMAACLLEALEQVAKTSLYAKMLQNIAD